MIEDGNEGRTRRRRRRKAPERKEREKVSGSETKRARAAAERDLETCQRLLKVIAGQTNSLFSPAVAPARLTASWLPWWGGLRIATGGGGGGGELR